MAITWTTCGINDDNGDDTSQSYRSTAADLYRYTTGLQIQDWQIRRERRMRFVGIIGVKLTESIGLTGYYFRLQFMIMIIVD